MEKTRTFNSSWKRSLRTILATPGNARNRLRRCTFLGIGNELKGDDAAGLIAARVLRQILQERAFAKGWRVEAAGPSFVLGAAQVIEAGTAPENFTGLLRKHAPERVLFLDAAGMDAQPGTVRVLDAGLASGFGASTHVQPLSTLAEYLAQALDCQVALIAIQPERLGFAEPMTERIARACNDVAIWLGDFIASRSSM